MQRVCTIRSSYTVHDVDGNEIDEGWEDGDGAPGSEGVAIVVNNRQSLVNAVVRHLQRHRYAPLCYFGGDGRGEDLIYLETVPSLMPADAEWPGEYQTCLSFEGLQPGELTRIFRKMTRSVK